MCGTLVYRLSQDCCNFPSDIPEAPDILPLSSPHTLFRSRRGSAFASTSPRHHTHITGWSKIPMEELCNDKASFILATAPFSLPTMAETPSLIFETTCLALLPLFTNISFLAK
ncbi:unnamed protein product [Lepeophtheirus salmonis]|uniref:(salmon louse) hypothetical protein n=1 Tax=Lepeophtheirus salmonis TaxID=72036 RepID=A0A7R8H2Z7_LEPSM|nr:unnamed protein product [Lepeophtheirus salmonis]CAF2823416.1 unnamed protein product [Lepeophtheirus salmonis]